MAIIAIISTPEKNGNTEAIVKAMGAAAEANGKEVKYYNLANMSNKIGCRACMACKVKGYCVQKDDVTPVLDDIRNAEGFILSTPVYFGDSCSQYRCLEDRFFSFIDGNFRPNVAAGKKFAVVTAAGSANADLLANKIEATMTGFFKFNCIGKISIITGNSPTKAANSPEILAQAAEIGKKF